MNPNNTISLSSAVGTNAQTVCINAPITTITYTTTGATGATFLGLPSGVNGVWSANTVTISGTPSVSVGSPYTYTVTLTGGCGIISTTGTISINSAILAPLSGGDVTECGLSPIQTLTATSTAPTGSTLVWYDAATGGSVVASPTLNSIGTVTYYSESVNSATNCSSSTRTPVILTINAAPIQPISGGDITECEVSPIQTLTATATAPTGSTLVWYDAATGGSIIASPTLNSIGTVTYYAESVNSTTNCPSLTRIAVTLTINPLPLSLTSVGILQCELSPIQTLTATSTAPTGSTLVWYDAATGGSVVASPTLNSIGTVTYYSESVNSQLIVQVQQEHLLY
ncbi:MAG: hypothetical protein IPO23_13605 [Flavobacterium sp.]|nr:hypothetical protein [Flavobacterium sp.]